MGILLVCHSTGDTEIMLDTAREVIKKSNDPIYILTVGKAATDKLNSDPLKKPQQIISISLSDILGADQAKSIENAELDATQLAKVERYLATLDIKRALIGTPSLINATAPFQIAERFADKWEDSFIYHDYLFQETEHAYWKALQQKSNWQRKFTWLAPTPQAKSKIEEASSEVQTEVVGHRAIDSAMLTQSIEPAKIASVREKLLLNEKQSLLFVSGTKNTDDDKALLNALLNTINSTGNTNVEIRLGLHPGHDNLNACIGELATLIKSYEGTHVAKQVKFVITEKIARTVDLSNIDPVLICRAEVSGDDAALAADGVGCAVPATLVNKAALAGKAAYYHQSDKQPFLPADRLHVGISKMGLFVHQVAERKMRAPASKMELQLPEQSAASIMARKLTKTHSAKKNYVLASFGILAVGIICRIFVGSNRLTSQSSMRMGR